MLYCEQVTRGQDGPQPHYRRLISQLIMLFVHRAFSRYDVDGDGVITVDDLQKVFKTQGRESSISDLIAWVRKRDSSGRGAVSLRDFSDHYQ